MSFVRLILAPARETRQEEAGVLYPGMAGDHVLVEEVREALQQQLRTSAVPSAASAQVRPPFSLCRPPEGFR
jgi:hypothetical protein